MFTNVAAGPDGVAAMEAALETYCRRSNLYAATDRNAVAKRIVDLYGHGNQTEAALLFALEISDRQSTGS